MSKLSVMDRYHKGWATVDKKRHELYDTIINDLAEDIHIPSRHTVGNLCEVAGYLSRRNQDLIEHVAGISGDLILLGASCLKWPHIPAKTKPEPEKRPRRED